MLNPSVNSNPVPQSPMIVVSQGKTTVDLSMISNTSIHNAIEADCLIVLNSDICADLLSFFVKTARHIVLCDGGANFFYKSQYKDAVNIKAVVGDMDSIQQQVREYYSIKAEIKDLHEDQDTNDLQKSINYAIELQARKIICLGVLGGRFDQQMCNLSVIQKYSEKYRDVEFIAVGKSSLLYAVKPCVTTTIKLSNFFIKNQAGLVSFCRAKVQTHGFKWNLGKQHGIEYLEWGVLVSSSNQIMDNEVCITTSHPIFFTIEFPFK